MRIAAQVLRHARYCSRISVAYLHLSNGNPEITTSRGAAPSVPSRLFADSNISRFHHQTSRALSISTANYSAGDFGRAGPFVEYERRISVGELADGDAFQVDTLRLLQRLYEQLVEHEDSCKLDRYKASQKAGRSRWLWSRFVPQSSYSPVKGLYLYGGVGTGKTMLMDLLYGQLPSNWRKRRRHFHDFMLDVHRRLQMHKGVADPLEVVAGEISDESVLLCLDEFMVMYENRARFLCTAETSPVELFEKIVTVADAQRISPRSSSRSQKRDDLDLCVDNELGFAKERTISRLIEMNSKVYLEQHEARLLGTPKLEIEEDTDTFQAS